MLVLSSLACRLAAAALFAVILGGVAMTTAVSAQPNDPPGGTRSPTVQQEGSRPAPQAIQNRRTTWWRGYLFWATVHYALGLASVIASAIVALRRSDPARTQARITLAAAAAIMTALLTFLRPTDSKTAYHRAWQLLDTAILKYETLPNVPLETVVTAVQQGEELLKDQ